MKRSTMLKLASETPYWDVIVIGGGASGLWCAYDAALRGFNTILLERGDFACSTSSKSTKLIHGGLRYLRQGHIGLVREALHERRFLALNAPHLVKPLEFVIPYYKSYERFLYGFGMGIYDFFAGPMGHNPHKTLSVAEMKKRCPTLKTKDLRGGCLFTDGQFDDARFAIELAKMTALHDGVLLNYVTVSSFIKHGNQIVGVKANDLINGNEIQLKGRVVINATGIFSDEIRKMDDQASPSMMVHARGSHIVLDKKFIPGNTAIVLPKTKDGRLAFAIPWNDRTLIGTTDIYTDHPVQEAIPSHEEVDFLLSAVDDYLTIKPSYDDILSTFAGIRPLVKKSSTASTSQLSRSHQITMSDNGLLTLAGGKWTTARKMAEDTIDYAIHAGKLENITCKTTMMPFEESAPQSSGKLLHKNLPYTEGDIKNAVENEMAVTLIDLLARRTRSLILDVKATLEIAPSVATAMQKQLGQTDAWRDDQLEKFKTFARSYLP